VSSDDDEDETAELQRELEKIKRERAEKREQEVSTGLLKKSVGSTLTMDRNKKRQPLKKPSENTILRSETLS
jgi:hypothetical protein